MTAPEDLLQMYERMITIRLFEERIAVLYRDGECPGFVHLSTGQEATAVGACWPLRTDDVITSTHRGHGHCLAKGLEPEGMFAELLARETGTNHGRGGSMHVADPRVGIFGANGIVAGGIPIAVGAATAAVVSGSDRVVVAFFGDGAVAQGAFHESANLASVWGLPIVFFCENNGWAEFSSAESQHAAPLRDRAAGYGLGHRPVDGNDVVAVAELMTSVVADLRAGGRPVVVEASTARWRGHYEGDAQRYRDLDSLTAEMGSVDALARLRGQLDEGVAAAAEQRIAARIGAAVTSARGAPAPDSADLYLYVSAPTEPRPETEPSDDSEVWRTMDALNSALADAMDADERVFLAGIDVSQAPFAITRGLRERFGERRVRDTPISETAVVGTAVGASMAGMRPVVEIMYLDFIGVCFDQLMNQAAKLRFMTGGAVTLPLVVRTQFGAGKSSGSQHSQSLEVLLAHIPGLKVVMPSTPADAYGLLRAAIDDPNPVVFIEHRLLYGAKGPKVRPGHHVPLGAAKVVHEGRDLTIVSWSRMVLESLAAAESLASEGIGAEVIDLRTVAPIDWPTIEASVNKTSRLLVAHEAVLAHGIGAEIAARAASEWFWTLDAPVGRVGAEATPPPYAPSLEQAWLPDAARIATAARRVMRQ